MTFMILHPDRNFLDARNPSSPFQYTMQGHICCWQYIDKNCFKLPGWDKKISVCVKGDRYDGATKQQLFNQIRKFF